MIIQNILNVLRQALVAILKGLPPVPAEWMEAIGWVGDAGEWLSNTLQNLGFLLPFAAFGSLIALWTGALVFWGAMQLLRGGLWLVGR